MNARVILVAGLIVVLAIVMPALAVAPSSNFNGTPTSGCSPLSVYFVDMSTGTLSDYNWTFGDGGASTALNVSHTYTVGVGTSTFTVSHGVNATLGAGSDIETKSAYITVNAACHTPIDPNVVDWANISGLIGNISRIFPGIIAMVLGILPLIFIGMIVGLVVGLFGAIMEVVKNITTYFK